MTKLVLLLTGTINTSSVDYMKRNDSESRINDYINAIERWLKTSKLQIVFVENSDFNPDVFIKRFSSFKNFEFIHFYGQTFPRNYGKGFGEILSIEYAFANSIHLKNADIIIKCNGRYFFEGVNKFYGLNAEIIANIHRNLSFADSRVFAFSPNFFFSYLLNYKSDLNDSSGVYFEHILAKAIHKFMSESGNWLPLPFPLIISGISGTTNKKYNSLVSQIKIYIKYYLFQFLNR